MAKSVRVILMQEGIYNKETVDDARKVGITVVWNQCMMKEHRQLLSRKP